ncbi:hypothetical protein MHIB_19750 [Mycolicibacter hiberniae]|uniref:Uncharacterized protein n=1 Tax=Mycolicibacter hiberniae TaxID=29314 RepID=A0A7I7X3W9_9MYCO|nr:hypothetical protein MHIB_19750 [Mycolicibacter hiberniae]
MRSWSSPAPGACGPAAVSSTLSIQTSLLDKYTVNVKQEAARADPGLGALDVEGRCGRLCYVLITK